MKRSLAERTREYANQLSDHPDALTYLVSQRGLSKALVSDLQIGYVGTPMTGDSWFRDCVSIPYIQPAGITSIKFRSLNGGEKYRYDKGQVHRIYNTPVLVGARNLVITEGEFDCMSFLEAGVPAVGVPGANSWKREWRRIFRNREVTVFCDGDEAGRSLGSKLADELWGARIVEAPDGEDANSLLLSEGPEYLRKLVNWDG